MSEEKETESTVVTPASPKKNNTPAAKSAGDAADFDVFLFKATAFFNQYKTLVIAAAVVLVAAVAGLFFWKNYQAGRETEAADALRKVEGFYQSGDYDKAISGDSLRATKGLKVIADNYSFTVSGNTAKLYLADSYYNKGDYENAEKYFDKVSTDSPYLESASIAGRAACAEQKKEFKKAAELFKDAAAKVRNDAVTPLYLSDAARNFELAGLKEDAIKLHERLKKEFSQTQYGRDAELMIAKLKN
jgi:outer membrane protein assembly factor BamD (BamD/ComL family)